MSNAPTEKTAAWISRAVADNPCRELDNDNIVTCPVRLGFPYLDKPQKAMEDGKEDKYSATLLFPEGADLSVIKGVLARIGQAEWGDQLRSYMQQDSFYNPIQDQAKKDRFEGFTPGQFFITANGTHKPGVVMPNLSPYTGRIYPGIWAICVIRPFVFNTRNREGKVIKRGLGCGLQQVMIVADDVEFGGGSIDVAKAFAGIKIESEINPNAAFGGASAEKKAVTAADLF